MAEDRSHSMPPVRAEAVPPQTIVFAPRYGPRPGRCLSVVTTTDPRAGHLLDLLASLDALAPTLSWHVEVIVVDDLQQWPCGEPPAELGQNHVECRVVRYPQTRGQLAAMTLGARQSRGDGVLLIDPDMHDLVPLLPAFLRRLEEGWSIVHGRRQMRQGLGLVRRLGSAWGNGAVRCLTGIRVGDINSPFALLARDTVSSALALPPGIHNARLYLYALHKANTCEIILPVPCFAGPSHYTLVALARLLLRQLGQCLRIRRFLAQNPTLLRLRSEEST